MLCRRICSRRLDWTEQLPIEKLHSTRQLMRMELSHGRQTTSSASYKGRADGTQIKDGNAEEISRSYLGCRLLLYISLKSSVVVIGLQTPSSPKFVCTGSCMFLICCSAAILVPSSTSSMFPTVSLFHILACACSLASRLDDLPRSSPHRT